MPIGKDGFEPDLINLQKFFSYKNQSVAYLKTTIWIKEKQKALFELGLDDGLKFWVNNKMVHQVNKYRGHNQAEDIVEVDLQQGWNTLLMRVFTQR